MADAPAIWHDARLAATRFAPVHWFRQVDSTNRYLLDESARGAPEGMVAVADEQTAGRGRLGRTWVAPPGASLLVSVLLRPRIARERWSLVTLAAALAAADALQATAGIDARVKWPNDLVVGDRKLAGLLAEADTHGGLVVGMGINVRWDEFPPDIAQTATACNLCGDPVTRAELLVAWLRHLERRLEHLDDVVAETRVRSATIGRRIRVELSARTFEALATGLDADGRLLVRCDGGTNEVVAAGDVVHVRPAEP